MTATFLDVTRDLQQAAWVADAACRGMNPTLFFPERGHTAELAKAVCRSCPVRCQCLDLAMINGERFGVFGGMSERERRKLRRSVRARERVA